MDLRTKPTLQLVYIQYIFYIFSKQRTIKHVGAAIKLSTYIREVYTSSLSRAEISCFPSVFLGEC
jgi:hypothetical protein